VKRRAGRAAEPLLERGQRDKPSAAPQAARRREDQGFHVAHAVGHGGPVVLWKSLREELCELRDRARFFAQDLASRPTDRRHVRVAHVPTPRAAPHVTALPEGHEERFHAQRVAGCDEVDGVAHQRHAHSGAGFDQARQLLVVKSLQSRPQADVRQVRCLRLHADEVLDGRCGRAAAAFEQELAREQRAVQRAPVENLGWHGEILRPCPSPCPLP